MNMAVIRQWHNYLGILIAPSVLFFALTGGLQIFGLHEAHGPYKPFAIVEKLGKLHKDQVFGPARHRVEAAANNSAPRVRPRLPTAEENDDGGLATTVLKWFFAFVALGLATSTGLGLWIGLSQARGRRLKTCLLAVGILFPVGVIVL